MIVHLVAGGLGGSMGALATIPLEVIQTRLQSSAFRSQRVRVNISTRTTTVNKFSGIVPYARYMVKNEGIQSLFKGLGTTLLGVTPSRAIYFAIYSKLKDMLNKSGALGKADGSLIHMTSSAIAAFINHTVTNPLWFIKTRLQLENQGGTRASAFKIVSMAYKAEGIRAFYRGLTASYVGISETVVHFTIYERLKAELLKLHYKSRRDFHVVECMLAAGISKCIATSLCYPHEVARTRLRQQESEFLGRQKYRSFFQTLGTVLREEGWRGLYGGLGTHVIRQVPNTAIMFFTYEGVVYILRDKM
ncbi:predicted protein [Nematostella vectensis]|uniref:Uncharacterized protein n=1 Tax=Nematostella vectensis TaxID=45351 RepID=A7RFZ8_NEMVE|nr:predicted protein [Nematostella vectensis]|eukprot:XP_001641750.1 predicted protein [Nematostella vectensis]